MRRTEYEARGDAASLFGKALEIDPADETLGLFFVHDANAYRVTDYHRINKNEIFFTVPDLPPGDYEVQLRKNGGNRKSAITYEKVLHAA